MSLIETLQKRVEEEGEAFLQKEHTVQDFDYLRASEYSKKFVVEYKPTDNCNYKCSYCYFYETGARGIQPEIFRGVVDMFKRPESEYTKKIKEFDEVFIFVYGGEPLLHRDIVQQVQELNTIHSNCTFLIQSNGSVWSIDKFKEACDTFDAAGIKYSFSFSWHSEYVKPNEFLKKVKYLHDRKVFDTIVYMTTLTEAKNDQKYIKMIKHLGLPIHVRTTLQESEAFRSSEYMDLITTEDSEPFVVTKGSVDTKMSFEDLTTSGYLSFKGLQCSAGVDSIQITPVGDIYRCDLDGLHSENKIANVLDQEIKLPVNLKCEHCFCSIYFSDKYKKEFINKYKGKGSIYD